MKATLRIPTKTEYAYIELEYDNLLNPEQAVEAYNEASEAYWGQGDEEMPRKFWNLLLDNYLNDGAMTPDQMASMSKKQTWMIHELDKAFARIAPKKRVLTEKDSLFNEDDEGPGKGENGDYSGMD